MITRKCIKCKKTKRLERFVVDKQSKTGYHNFCQECEKKRRREYYLKNKKREFETHSNYVNNNKEKVKLDKRNAFLLQKYNISLADYNLILEKQKNKCAICFGLPSGKGRNGNVLHVDHCHDTGKVRGLLCADCNLAIGKFKEDQNLIRRAYEYLARLE